MLKSHGKDLKVDEEALKGNEKVLNGNEEEGLKCEDWVRYKVEDRPWGYGDALKGDGEALVITLLTVNSL